MSEDAAPYAGFDETTAYRTKVMHGVMSAVVDAGAIEGSGGGLINLDIALEGICDAIAAIENASGVSTNARQRRETADICRTRIIRTGSALAKSEDEGQPLPWRFETIGKPS